MSTILEIQHLKKYFASQKAVDDISFKLEKGSIFGLLGPNGAGKTTLIRMITGIFYPDEGSIMLNGKAFNPVNDVIDIGYMPEERGLYKKMKVGEQAMYLAQLKGLSKAEAFERVKYWFEKFEIAGWWDKKVEELSKGMQQKVQFITTVVHKPQLLIFDEPFTGFDPINANLIKQEIMELKDKGATILFSTHNMGTVEDLCDHIALINKSKKILDGPVHEIKETYKANIFEVTYLGDFTRVEKALGNSFSILAHDEGIRGNTIRIQHLNGNSNNDLLRVLLNVAEIRSFSEVIPDMNDIFIRVVKSYNAETE